MLEQTPTAPRLPDIGSSEPDAIGLGRYYDLAAQQPLGRLRFGGETSVVLFGPNGTGKGTRVLAPNLLQCEGRSIVVIDPTGELAAITAPYRRTLGPVHVINPFGVLTDIPGYEDLKSCGFNPLATLDPKADNFTARASQLADALIKVPEGKDAHWSESARSLLSMLIMHTVIEARESLERPKFARVRDLLCQPSGETKAGTYGIPALALKLANSPIAGLRNAAGQFTEWRGEIQSIASDAMRQTKPFDDAEIARDLSKNGVDFRRIKEKPTTVYVILPPDMIDRHSKWLRLVLTAAIQGVLRLRKPGEPKTLFVLDEFFALGHLEIISTVWNLVRGYGIQMLPCLQYLGQLKKLYGEHEAQGFLSAAGAVASLTPNDSETAEWLSKRAGERTEVVMNSSTGQGQGAGGGMSTNAGLSYSQTKVPALPAHQLFGMRPGYTVNFFSGLSDYVPAYTPPYWDIRQCDGRARDNPYAPPSSWKNTLRQAH